MAAIIKNLYDDFLLRDFFGKMIPGSILIFSAFSLFVSPKTIIRTINAEKSLLGFVILGGLAWTIVLGLQSVAEWVGVWRYYPPDDAQSKTTLHEMTVQMDVVADFLRIACEGEKNQYERFVVIKEATGNLFICLMLSTPLMLLALLGRHKGGASFKKDVFGLPFPLMRTMALATCWIVVAVGLIVMNREHVNKQYYFAKGMLERFKKQPCQDKDAKPDEGKQASQ